MRSHTHVPGVRCRSHPHDRGSALILVVMFFALISALMLVTTQLAIADLHGSDDAVQAGVALDAAEAGVAQAVTYIRTNGTRKLVCYPATCTTNPWNPSMPVSADTAGGGHWTAYLTPIPPNTVAVPGTFRVHSVGTAAGPAQRTLETDIQVTPFGLPEAVFARTINLGGTVNLQQISMLSTGCVYKRSQITINTAAGNDLAYNVPVGVHSSQIITESQGSGQYCPTTKKPIHGGLSVAGVSLTPCNSSYPYDQDSFGGSLTGLSACAGTNGISDYLPRDIDGDGKLDVNGSYLRNDAALFASFGVKRPALTAAQLDQLRTTAQAQGNYWTSTQGWTLPTDPHSVLFFDLNGGTVDLSPLGNSIFARTSLAATDPACIDASLLVIVAGGNAQLNSNGQLAASIYLSSPAPYGDLQKSNGTNNQIGLLYADTMDLTGNFNVSLDGCYLSNMPPGLFDVTPGAYRELDR